MGKWLWAWIGILIGLGGLGVAAEKSANYHWTKEQMNPRVSSTGGRQFKKISAVRLLPQDQGFPRSFDCHEENCQFDLYYFTGLGFNRANAKRKNILFIAGGPGQLVNNQSQENRMLGFLEKQHNVVYFDLRGGGRSVIDGDNKYDYFLRAEYVADDIELIRKDALSKKPWDAIYSHSWGSLPAQLYAAKFGPTKVKSLILSAPVVRDRDTHDARTKLAMENLERIYLNYRTEPCNCQDKKLAVKVITLFGETKENIADVKAVVGPPGSNNFCFLAPDEARRISEKLGKILSEIENRFGSVDFVTDHYEELQKSTDPQERLGFPREFYVALKRLQFTGAPEGDFTPYLSDFTAQVNAALVIGHNIILDERRAGAPPAAQSQCAQEAPFFAESACKNKLCAIVDEAREQSRQSSGGLESLRAHEVFGLYDGVARALLRPGMVQLDADGCFTGQAVAEFTSGSGGGKERVRAGAKRIGIDPTRRACLWTPKKHAHEVPTLILKGARDTVIAGCQAEDFYRDGLRGERALLEFRGMGHGMVIPTMALGTLTEQGMALTAIVEKFLALPVAEFQKDAKVSAGKKLLQAEFRVPPPSRAGCPG